jgi:hypothetical protein
MCFVVLGTPVNSITIVNAALTLAVTLLIFVVPILLFK